MAHPREYQLHNPAPMVRSQPAQARTEAVIPSALDESADAKRALFELKSRRDIWLSKLHAELERQTAFELRYGRVTLQNHYNNVDEIVIRRKIAELDEQIQLVEFAPTARRRERQSTRDKAEVRRQAQEEIERAPKVPKRKDLAESLHEREPGKNYQIERLIVWIRPMFPDYTPKQPGRKQGR